MVINHALVDLSNDILGTILAYHPASGHAGDNNYLPDPDVNKDGVFDLTNDILGVIQQYLFCCEDEFYQHS